MISDETWQLAITAFFGFMTTIATLISAWYARRAHNIVNSKLDEWKEMYLKSARAEGKLEGREEMSVAKAMEIAGEAKGRSDLLAEQKEEEPLE